jgi:DNA-directed RNA polymerase specialized sigma24 family protein
VEPERSPLFEEYVRARMPALSGIAYLLTGDHHPAEDLVQCRRARLLRARLVGLSRSANGRT